MNTDSDNNKRFDLEARTYEALSIKQQELIGEVTELMKISGSFIEKVK
jgi:hypothetical protein